MGIFSTKSPPLIGVDISSTAVKVLELNSMGKNARNFRVEMYGFEQLPEGAVEDKTVKDPEAVGMALQRIVKKNKPKAQHAAVAVAGAAVIYKVIQMPNDSSEDDLEEMVVAEAEQYIPYPMDEVSLDFQVLGPAEQNSEEEVDVMLVASKTENVDDRLAVLDIAGLKPQVVDFELFAMENAFSILAMNDPEIDSSDIIALIDVGATTTSFSVLHDLKIVYTREQPFGGKQLTEQIQQRYGLSYEEAMMAKRQGGLPEDYEAELLEPFKEAMAQEVSRAIQYYYSSSTSGTIAHTVIAGGCASIPGVIELIGNKVGGHVTLANPFASMSVSNKVNKKALMNDAPALMITCGLALRSFDK